jgi:hypothetical protein
MFSAASSMTGEDSGYTESQAWERRIGGGRDVVDDRTTSSNSRDQHLVTKKHKMVILSHLVDLLAL